MPLTQKGQEILASMKQEYGEEKGEEIFYASRNAGKISGVDAAAGVILTAPSGRALFMKRQGGDHENEWGFPFGSVEGMESPEEAAIRETGEETGLTGLTIGDLTKLDEGNGYATFRANTDSEFSPTLNREHSEFRWASLNELPEPMHPNALSAVKKLLGEAIKAGEMETEAEKKSEAAGAVEVEAQKKAAALLDGKENEHDGFKANSDHITAMQADSDKQAKAREHESVKHGVTAAALSDSAQDRREYDTNGWFEVFDNPLSTVGVYPYRESTVKEGGSRDRMVNVYRPAEELSNEEAVKSFRLLPWIDDHPDTLLGDESQKLVPAERKGVHGATGEQIYFRDGTLFGNIKVFSQELARKIAAGKRELSMGYRCDFVPQEGVYDGTAYQYVQKNIRGNHNASVKAGRMGSGVRVLDAAECFTFALDLKEPDMAVCQECGRTHGAQEDCMDADTMKLVGDSFNSLVGQLEKKGYSKEYATKVAGKVAAEKGDTGHDSKGNSTGDTTMPTAKDGETKSPQGKGDSPGKKDDLKPNETKDSMTEEEEASKDAMDAEKDKEEEAKDEAEKKDDKEARDRKSARDRRAGARDARQSARDKAKDARDKAAKDAVEAEKEKGKGMDAAEVSALVKQEVTAATATLGKTIRQEEHAKASLYGRISPIIGAFDHSEMTHVEMASYGLKKLGAPEAKADPVTALDFYLAGRTQVAAPVRHAQDASAGDSFIDKYLSSAA